MCSFTVFFFLEIGVALTAEIWEYRQIWGFSFPLSDVSGWDSSASVRLPLCEQSQLLTPVQLTAGRRSHIQLTSKTVLPSSGVSQQWGRNLFCNLCFDSALLRKDRESDCQTVSIQSCRQKKGVCWYSKACKWLFLKRFSTNVPSVFLAVLPIEKHTHQLVQKNMLDWFVDSVRPTLHISRSFVCYSAPAMGIAVAEATLPLPGEREERRNLRNDTRLYFGLQCVGWAESVELPVTMGGRFTGHIGLCKKPLSCQTIDLRACKGACGRWDVLSGSTQCLHCTSSTAYSSVITIFALLFFYLFGTHLVNVSPSFVLNLAVV